jgi:Tol biopolymer transport system component/predicted Ser/Thr protein kinase
MTGIMKPAPGSRLDHYEIIELIGKGGMGEVFRAKDTRLPRDAAIKVSAEQFSERFSRETKIIAGLNHPNICTLYDVGLDYLVMELVEGPTLADRMKEGPLSLAEASGIARQVADALEYAHEKGVVHRDLKPGNIKIRPDGVVKVLDFGLAKVGGTPVAQSDQSPTITGGATAAGMILGTAAYMSPEQAKGKEVDKRADIYAFGVVFYEMLSGTGPHKGDTLQETLASVLKDEPDLSKVPVQAHRLLKRCLEKDPQKRLRHIGDVMSLLDDAPVVPKIAPPPVGGSRWLWRSVSAIVVIAAAVLVLGYLYLRPKPAPQAVGRFEIAAPEQGATAGLSDQSTVVSVSPDGSRLVFFGLGDSGSRLWLRRLDSLESRPLEGTDGATGFPFWSPDSRFIVFGTFTDGKLKKIEVAGGPAQILCDTGPVYGGFFTSDGRIIFSGGPNRPELWQVAAAGGIASAFKGVEQSQNDALVFPSLLPDGRHFLYGRGNQQSQGIYLGSLDAKPEPSKKLFTGDEFAYAPSADAGLGYILSVRTAGITDLAGTLMAQPFDTRKLQLAGDPVPVAERVGRVAFSASATGVLVYRAGVLGTGGTQLTWYDRQGKLVGMTGDPGAYGSMAFSPDGTKIVAERVDPQSSNRDLWMFDLARDLSTRFTFDPGAERFPVWSPDGSRIVYGLDLSLYQKLSNGGGDAELLFKSDQPKIPVGWSHDGRFLLFSWGPPERNTFVLPLDEGGKGSPLKAGKPYLFLPKVTGGRFSPDEHWVAYPSNESGKYEVYVRPFDPKAPNGSPPGGGVFQVSKGGGSSPHWSGDGKELYYLSPDGNVMAAPVTLNPIFQPGTPKTLFKFPGPPITATVPYWDVAPDGKRFLRAVPLAANSAAPFTVVLNWTATVKRN